MDISRRTLYRYLGTLASSIDFQGEKLVVYDNEFNKKVWKIACDESTIDLNRFDINSYAVLRSFIPKSLSGPGTGNLKKLDKMVYGMSGKNVRGNVDPNNLAFTGTDYTDASSTDAEHSILEEMMEAIQSHRKIRVDEFTWDVKFLPEGFETAMMVLPLRLLHHFGLIYVCVYVEEIDKISILPITGIISMSVTTFTFAPAQFYCRLKQYLDTTFGIIANYDDTVYNIEIEFTGTTGHYIEVMNWHSSQSFEHTTNGNIILRLRCGINRELIGFVLYYLNNARVLKPAKLKGMVVEKLKQTLNNYSPENELVYETNICEKSCL
jgi:hypothetical protein